MSIASGLSMSVRTSAGAAQLPYSLDSFCRHGVRTKGLVGCNVEECILPTSLSRSGTIDIPVTGTVSVASSVMGMIIMHVQLLVADRLPVASSLHTVVHKFPKSWPLARPLWAVFATRHDFGFAMHHGTDKAV